MKTLIQEIGDYTAYAVLEEVESPQSLVELRFESYLANSKQPDEAQVKMRRYLTPEERARLKAIL